MSQRSSWVPRYWGGSTLGRSLPSSSLSTPVRFTRAFRVWWSLTVFFMDLHVLGEQDATVRDAPFRAPPLTRFSKRVTLFRATVGFAGDHTFFFHDLSRDETFFAPLLHLAFLALGHSPLGLASGWAQSCTLRGRRINGRGRRTLQASLAFAKRCRVPL